MPSCLGIIRNQLIKGGTRGQLRCSPRLAQVTQRSWNLTAGRPLVRCKAGQLARKKLVILPRLFFITSTLSCSTNPAAQCTAMKAEYLHNIRGGLLNIGMLWSEASWTAIPIHSKSEKVCGFYFSVSKNLRKSAEIAMTTFCYKSV